MNEKTQLITLLRDEFNRWEEFLAGIDEGQIIAPDRIAHLSIKDILAHLTTWQKISVARMEAALHQHKPEYPGWPAELDPTSEDLDPINAWIYNLYREQPWSDVHREWMEKYLRFLELCEAVPEKDLSDAGMYPWLNGYPLSAVLLGSYEHHAEHLERLLILLRHN